LEFAASTYCVFYLYKYIFKGNKKVQLALNNIGGLHEKDEINIFLRGRMLSSMDAMWRIYGFQTYPAPDPSVTLLKVKLPAEVNAIRREGKFSDLYVYFQRPPELHHLRFCEFFQIYDYGTKLDHARFRNDMREIDDNGQMRYCFIPSSENLKAFYIYQRSDPDDLIVRLNGIPPDAGEIYYLRLILRDMPMKSFDDILTLDQRRFSTFQEAAFERGLLANESEAWETFQEARLYQPPVGLRALFVLLTTQGFPSMRIYDDPDSREALYLDFLTNDTPPARAYAQQKLLEDLHDRFSRVNKDMQDYGLPKPANIKTELERERDLIGDGSSSRTWLQELHVEAPNTEEMDNAYHIITQAIERGETRFFLIRGCGGAGKTQFLKKVLLFFFKV
jgi:hypothetical protein